MTREEFYQSLRTSNLLSCYLFEGEEEYTKESALRALRETVLRDDLTGLNVTVLTDPDADQLIACAETLPMMAERRLVLVKECSMLEGGKTGEEGEKAASKGGAADRIAEYVTRLPSTTCLVFHVKGKANGVRKLHKQIARLGGVVSFDKLDQGLLIKWVAKELKGYGKQIDRYTAEQLIFAVGQDMHRLHNELAKLAAFSGDSGTVTGQDVAAICTKSTEYKVFDLSDALVRGNAAQAGRLMDEMLKEGEQRLMLLSLLQRQYRQLLFVKILSAAGMPLETISRQLGVAPFIAKKLQPLAQPFAAEALYQALNMLVETEFAVKSGQMPEEGALEQAVYRLIADRRREMVS